MAEPFHAFIQNLTVATTHGAAVVSLPRSQVEMRGVIRLLVTNLARSRFSAEQVGQLYRLRWQIELLFKEWKS